MKSGLYIVTLNNDKPISVNAHDPRVADKTIRVTKNNCKFGKAKNLEGQRKNYYKTFGEHNVNYRPIALVEDIAMAEKVVLSALDEYRVRSPSGRKNEWLEEIDPESVLAITFAELDKAGIAYQSISPDGHDDAMPPPVRTAKQTPNPRNTRKDYSGLYRFGRQPRNLASHNEVTWRKLVDVIDKNRGHASFDRLTTAAQRHRHRGEDKGNPQQFVVYCIKNGWLEQAN